jgi:hypothetical protein
MASWTQVYMTRKRIKAKKMGRSRKKATERNGSTPTRAAFFGDAAASKK